VDWMLNQGFIEDRLRYQGSIRQRSTLNLAHKYGVDIEAAQRIAQFALSLFDQTQGVLHAWTVEERDLLWAAAVLHNCGHFVSHSAHHKHSYYLIRNGGLLGYTDAEIEIIANLARYHRKGAPKKRHQNYQNLAHKTQRQIVDQLSAILKLATGLDRRQVGAVSAVRCDYNLQQKTMTLHVQPNHPQEDCELELWSLTYKKLCFETEFGVELYAQLER
jgi:exopolyphosphatase / guanosine-5'-triphosphate,3'-diphosphate pyrophosphatase